MEKNRQCRRRSRADWGRIAQTRKYTGGKETNDMDTKLLGGGNEGAVGRLEQEKLDFFSNIHFMIGLRFLLGLI